MTNDEVVFYFKKNVNDELTDLIEKLANLRVRFVEGTANDSQSLYEKIQDIMDELENSLEELLAQKEVLRDHFG